MDVISSPVQRGRWPEGSEGANSADLQLAPSVGSADTSPASRGRIFKRYPMADSSRATPAKM